MKQHFVKHPFNPSPGFVIVLVTLVMLALLSGCAVWVDEYPPESAYYIYSAEYGRARTNAITRSAQRQSSRVRVRHYGYGY